MKGDLVMKFSTLALLIALSPVAALAAGTESPDLSSPPLHKTKKEAAFSLAGPCAAPEKALRWSFAKKPDISASRDSVGPDDLKKVVKITPRVKPANPRTADQAEPVKIVKPAASSGRKPRTCGTGPWHKPGLKT
jgi:hypothetical protein